MLIYPYNPKSASAKVLSKALSARRIKHNSTTFIGTARKKVINWGACNVPDEVMKCQVWNHPHSVEVCADKLLFMKLMMKHDVRTPDWTENINHARELAEDTNIVCRTLLRANSGRGIVVASEPAQVVQAPLYTMYVKSHSEWRVHIFKGEVFDVQRKVKAPDVEPKDWKIRNHDNGFIFQRHDIDAPEAVEGVAFKAFQVSGLDFGAVDVLYKEKKNKAYVLEINTAPGLEGTTLENYIQQFKINLSG